LIAGFNLFFHVIYINVYNISDLKHRFEDRDAIYSGIYSKKGWDVITKQIPSGSKVLLITVADFSVFPIFLRRPDLDITLTGVPLAGGVYNDDVYRESFKLNGNNYNLAMLKPEDFNIIQKNYDNILVLGEAKKVFQKNFIR